MWPSKRQAFKNTVLNIPGWCTSRKIVVIESDDWGSIRMPNINAYKILSKNIKEIKNNPYCKVDTLASAKDLAILFEVLTSFKDKNNNHPVITANTVVANPNFFKIKESDFHDYTYEPFTETLKNYYPKENTWQTWEEGMVAKVFYPQFHGREHVNVSWWLKKLQNNCPDALTAFDLGCWVIPNHKFQGLTRNIQASYDVTSDKEEIFINNSVQEGLQLFYKLFGYRSKSFIANNFIWSDTIESTLNKNDVRYIQGMKYQKFPLLYSFNKRKMRRRILGSSNAYNQLYLTRNCTFEPSQRKNDHDSVKSCLRDIQNAFFWKKPAIITSHRLNFIGGLYEKNRETNIKQLQTLLNLIQIKWPNVEFMTSDQLGDLIVRSKTYEK